MPEGRQAEGLRSTEAEERRSRVKANSRCIISFSISLARAISHTSSLYWTWMSTCAFWKMTPELGADNLSTLPRSPYPLQINTTTPSHSGEMKPFQRKQFTWQVSNSAVLLGKAVHLWMSRQMRHRGLGRYSCWLIVFASWKLFIVTATGDKVVSFFFSPSPCLFLVHPFPTC